MQSQDHRRSLTHQPNPSVRDRTTQSQGMTNHDMISQDMISQDMTSRDTISHDMTSQGMTSLAMTPQDMRYSDNRPTLDRASRPKLKAHPTTMVKQPPSKGSKETLPARASKPQEYSQPCTLRMSELMERAKSTSAMRPGSNRAPSKTLSIGCLLSLAMNQSRVATCHNASLTMKEATKSHQCSSMERTW